MNNQEGALYFLDTIVPAMTKLETQLIAVTSLLTIVFILDQNYSNNFIDGWVF